MARQFDFLKPPDKKRNDNRRKSIASLANSQYSNITYQSSVVNNYQGSMLSCIENTNNYAEEFDKLDVASDDESNLRPKYMKLQKISVKA